MSDSDDDNIYSDYLASRRAIVAKKRQHVDDDSDSDDGIDNAFRTALQKKRTKKNGVAEKVPRTHEELINSKSKQMEDSFRQSLYNVETPVTGRSTNDGAVKAALQMCESCVLRSSDDETGDPGTLESEAYYAITTRVEIDVLDCEELQNGKTTLMVPLFETFLDVRKRIAATWRCDIEQVLLTLEGVPLGPDATPDSLGIVPMALPLKIIAAHRKEALKEEVVTNDDDTHSRGTPGGIMLNVHRKNRKKSVRVAARPEMTLLELKAAIYQTFLLEPPSEERLTKLPPPAKMKVKHDGAHLTDDTATLEEIGMEDADRLDI